jgi:antitoxin VapB
MAFSIKNSEADRLARELVERTGEDLTQAVLISLRERLARLKRRRPATLAAEILRIARHSSQRPLLDQRPSDEIVGYGSDGLPS